MHKQLIKEANDIQLRDFIDDTLGMLKETNPDTYEKLEMHLYNEIYGCHFCDWLLDKALKSMSNEDGSKGKHWSLDQTNTVAKQMGIDFTDFNQYDWCYTLNMIYSDYYGSVPNDNVVYANMAIKFLEDKDAPDCKAFKYYMAMKN